MKTLYLTDLDGTLLDETGYVSAQSIAILNRLLANGVMLSFATARSIVSSTHVTAGVNWTLPVITSNGSSIVDPLTRQAVTQIAFTAEELQPIIRCVTGQDLCPVVFSYIDGQEQVSWLRGQENVGLQAYLREPARANDQRLRPVECSEQLWQGAVSCVVCMGRKDDFVRLHAQWSAEETYQTFLSKQLYSDIWWLEVLPRQATKANAALQLKAMLGCDRIVFFGDGENDASLFAVADEAYATANAVPQLKAVATAVIGSNREDGVARWLERYALLPG